MDTKIIVLPAPKFCGRAFKIKELSPADRLEATGRAASEMAQRQSGKVDLSDFEQQKKYEAILLRELVKEMLVACSKETGFKSTEDYVTAQNASPPRVSWQTLNAEVFLTPGEYEWGSFLKKSIDHEALVAVLNRTNGYSQDELDAIVGKALPVSEG